MKKKTARHVASDRYAVYRECTVRGLFMEITEYVYIPYTINQYTCVRAICRRISQHMPFFIVGVSMDPACFIV